jgi:hypothetical protein
MMFVALIGSIVFFGVLAFLWMYKKDKDRSPGRVIASIFIGIAFTILVILTIVIIVFNNGFVGA